MFDLRTILIHSLVSAIDSTVDINDTSIFHVLHQTAAKTPFLLGFPTDFNALSLVPETTGSDKPNEYGCISPFPIKKH
jgi:hypothetical protein